MTKTFRLPKPPTVSVKPKRFLRSMPFLIAVLGSSSALAEQSPAWVDPPAKEQAEPAAPESEVRAPELPAAGSNAASNSEQNGSKHSAGSKAAGTHDGRGMRFEPNPPGAGTARLEPDQRAEKWAGEARRFATTYLGSVSAQNAQMLASAPLFYGERVQYHGRSMSVARLIEEKRRFVRRWPQRRYIPQQDSMQTTCDTVAETCQVRTRLGFRAESPARNSLSLGVSELVLTVSFSGGRPVIVSESSRVLRRGSMTFDTTVPLERAAKKWQRLFA